MGLFTKTERIHGHLIPPPRLTGQALRRFGLWVLAPFLLLCLALDVALYFVFRDIFGACYGILCFFG